MPSLGLAADPNRAAEFTISLTVAQTNPPAFGAEYVHQQRINNWTLNPGMEPLVAMRYWQTTGGGVDATGTYATCNTRLYDTTGSGFYDGGHYRLYREITNALTGQGEIQKIREGTIPAGGYVAAGYEEINLATVNSPTPNRDATDTYRLENGVTWYYAVKAHDTKGNWSAFSAPVAGVTPQSGLNNGPRIATLSVANPTVGRTYTSGSPFATLSAVGGTAPRTWSVVAGALPSGMQVNASGAVYGTCATNVEAQFTVRVTDAAAQTHERAYWMFRQLPPAADPAPAAPSNVVCEAGDGFVYLTWDLPPDADVDYCRVFRSRVPAAQHMERIYLGSGEPLPVAEDLLFVERTFTNAPPPETRSLRVFALQDTTDWTTYAGSGVASTSVVQEIVVHSGALPTELVSENPGESCLQLSCAQPGEFGVWHYKTGGTGDSWWSVSQLTPGKTYRMECWVRGEGLTGNTVRFLYGSYVNQTVTGIVNGVWSKLHADFAVTNWVSGTPSVFGPHFRFQGPGTVYVDNAVVYGVDEPRGVGHLTSSVYDGLWREYIGPTHQASKGALRTRYLSAPLRHVMNPALMSLREWTIDYGANSGDPLHLHDTLQASYESGTNATTRTVPWITVNLNWKEQDFVDLVEYLAGPADTPCGALRVAQRGGNVRPWTDEFTTIYLEMGNEPWNAGYFFAFRGGFSDRSGQTYGRWCQYLWDYVAGHSPHWAAASGKIGVLLGGWAASLNDTGFSGMAVRNCPIARGMGFTSYLGGWEANDPVGGTVWTDEGVQQWLAYNDRSGGAYIDNVAAFQARMAAQGHPLRITMYEGGPSYLMNGLNGVSLTTEEQEVSRNYGRTLAAGVGTLDFWLYGMYRGVQEQAYFTFSQDQGLWTSHTAVHTGYRPHPSWLALQLFNRHASDSAMLTATVAQVPTYDLLNDDGSVKKPDLALASCYAFRRGDRFSLFVLNKKLDGAHDGLDFGDGRTPVTVHLPFTNATAITLHKLVGDPRLTNRDALNFQIVSQAVDAAHFSSDFVLNAETGGATNGMPSGVFLYTFDGCLLPDPPGPPPDLQALFDAAGPGGTVVIPAGVYTQDVAVGYAVTVAGDGFTLEGTFTLDDGAALSLATNVIWSSLQVAGSAAIDGGNVTAGTLQVASGATLVVSNGSLAADGVTLSGSFTLDEHWGGALVPQPVPFADDFERYAAGQPLAGLGYFGWSASDARVTVQNAAAHDGEHGVEMPDGTALDAHVEPAVTRLWTDLRVRPPRGAAPTDAPASDESVRLYVTLQGLLAVATNGGWDVCATDAFGMAVPPVGTGWSRVSFHHDYARRTVAVFLDGRLIREAVPFLGSSATAYRGFACRNPGGDAVPVAHVDGVSVGATLPHDLDDVTDADADGDRGYDGDADGLSDATEIHVYGNVATYWGQFMGSSLILR
jgi:hypothetical protein